MSKWNLGTIGFSYKDWLGPFYPPGTTQREYLSYYCKVFNSVELDTTFHSTPRKSTVQSWLTTTLPEFKFCLKTPRVITHDLGLKGARGLMGDFIESLTPLMEKLGPILIQLPPKYSQDNYSTLRDFLEALPQTHHYAIEFRHPSWYNTKTSELLSYYRISWVTIDYPNIPSIINKTSDFLYLRWIGLNGMYQYHTHERVDKTAKLKWWLQALYPFLDEISEVYGFFNNDYAGYAAGTCRRFKDLAGFDTGEHNIAYQERFC